MKKYPKLKIAYLDCPTGISGDMLLGALIDAGLDQQTLVKELKKLNIGKWELTTKKVSKKGLRATQVIITSKDTADERHIDEINTIIKDSSLQEKIKHDAKKIFLTLANAEAHVHNTTINRVHFHEVGALDTIIDVVGSVAGLHMLGIEKVYCSELPLGKGFITFSHGTWPSPAPAVLELLKNTPIVFTDIATELVTPTGAAIVTTLADFSHPKMKIEAIGYGAGSKDLAIPNILRLIIGEEIRK